MPSMKLIKRRIASIKGTKQIMKAMNLVAAAKLQKAKQRLDAVRPMFADIQTLMDSVKACEGVEENVYFRERKVKRSAYVLITSDRGLCGGYNTNICKLAFNLGQSLKDLGREVQFYCIGNKSKDFFRRAGADIMGFKNGISENPFYEDAVELAQLVMPLYESGEIDEVHVCYTEFVSAITYEPKSLPLLPLKKEDFDDVSDSYADFIKFEPGAVEVLDYVIPKYISTIILAALSTSAASGQAATMTAMDSATENAENIIENLTLLKNRVRQAAITQEISEIVGGASALE
jgi:F-type H+-transporting ATPase subunit gamma